METRNTIKAQTKAKAVESREGLPSLKQIGQFESIGSLSARILQRAISNRIGGGDRGEFAASASDPAIGEEKLEREG